MGLFDSVFDLAAKISLDTTEFDNGMDSAEEKGESFFSKLKSGLGTAAKISGVAFGAMAGGAGLLGKALMGATSQTAIYGDTIDKTSQKIGISAEAYQEWDAVLQHSGASAGSLTAVMRTLSTAVENGDESFEKIGISLDSLQNLSKEEIFEKVISSLQEMEDGTERTAIAQKLLGRGAMEFGALLNTSAEDTKAMRDRVHELGGVMSNEAVKAAARYQDSLQDMKTAMSGITRDMSSEFLPSIADVMDGLASVFSGENGGVEKITDGFAGLMSNIEKQLPKVLDIGTAIVNSLSKSLPSMAKKIPTALKKIMPSLTKTFLSVVDALIDVVTDPDTIESMIDAAVSLAVGIASGLIKAIPKIVESVPKIIEALAKGILSGAGQISRAFMEIFTGIDTSAIREELSAYADEVVAFGDKIAGVKPSILDVNDLLSENGRTISDLDAMINEKEGNITSILSTALGEQRGLRDDELESIRNYVDELRELQNEKLEIYRQNQVSELTKIRLEAGSISEEGAAQFLANTQAAYDEAQSATDTWYTNELTRIENFYKARGEVGSAAYLEEQKTAHDNFVKMSAENQSYFDEAHSLIQGESKRWAEESVDGFAEIGNTMKNFLGQYDSDLGQFFLKFADWSGALSPAVSAYGDMLKSLDLQSAASFLELTAQMKKSGKDIDSDSQEMVKTILSAFEGLPGEMSDTGKETLLGIVKGLDDEIPELENASEMTADEIIDTIKEKLNIHSPSRVMQDVGQNVVQGLWNGINDNGGWLASNLAGWTQKIVDSLKSNLENQMNLATMGMGYSVNQRPSAVNYNHSGTIHVNGVNNRGEFIGAADLVYNDLVNRLAMEVRT